VGDAARRLRRGEAQRPHGGGLLVSRWQPANRRAALASLALSAGFVLLLGWKSFEVIDAMEGISFTSIPVGQPVMYWALPVGSALMLVAFAQALRERLQRDD
jgi:TRAP-type C4-dicarboxylate transport system permease small subunit